MFDLLEQVALAGGNPYLLTELLAGLRDEGAVRISGGRARLSSARLPERVRTGVGRRLDGLSPRSYGIPLGRVLAEANRHDSPLLARGCSSNAISPCMPYLSCSPVSGRGMSGVSCPDQGRANP
jgi:hypothetical protein